MLRGSRALSALKLVRTNHATSLIAVSAPRPIGAVQHRTFMAKREDKKGKSATSAVGSSGDLDISKVVLASNAQKS